MPTTRVEVRFQFRTPSKTTEGPATELGVGKNKLSAGLKISYPVGGNIAKLYCIIRYNEKIMHFLLPPDSEKIPGMKTGRCRLRIRGC